MTFLFGFHSTELSSLADSLARWLGIEFLRRDSLWRGGDYFFAERGEETYLLQTNNDGGPPGEPAEENFADFASLIYIETKRWEDLTSILSGLDPKPELLRISRY
jgi:hypothetical protein